jgi:hypothetical protein
VPTHGSRAMVGVASLSCRWQALGTLVSAAEARERRRGRSYLVGRRGVDGGTLVSGAVGRAVGLMGLPTHGRSVSAVERRVGGPWSV